MRAQSEFESPLPHFETRSGSGFHFVKNYCAKNAPMKDLHYKDVRLVKGTRWYVEFYFKIPEGIRQRHGGKEWKRFKVYENINRKKGDAKVAFADLVLRAVNEGLRMGANPFKKETALFVKKEGIAATGSSGMEFFKDNITEKSLDKDTATRYCHVADLFAEYLLKVGKQNIPMEKVDELLVTECLQHYRKSVPWSNRTYNNHIGFLSIIFNFLKRKKKISHNPCDQIEKLKFNTTKHRYYDDKMLKLVSQKLKEKDPTLYLVAQFVYYAGVRSSKEILNLQVGDILMDRNRIRFRAPATKGKREDYILLDPKLKTVIEESGIMEYPAEYYVFDVSGRPTEKRSSGAWMPKHFVKIRKALKLPEAYTIYSFKHTRAVHLLTDGAQPVDIMQLFRHHDLTTTTKYIRDLGFDLNAKFTEKSRTL